MKKYYDRLVFKGRSGILVVFLVFLLAINSNSQPSDGVFFLGLDQIEEVQEPGRWSTRQFIYRQNNENIQRFYRVPMTDMLFGSKKAFALPQQIELETRMRIPLATTRAQAKSGKFLDEVLLNERLALTESDSLFVVLPNGNVQALAQVTEMGVALLFSSQSLQCTRVDRRGPGNVKSLPTFYYSLQGATQVCVVHKPGYFPKELDPLVVGHSFRQSEVLLNQLPVFSPRGYLPALDLDPEALSLQLEQTDSLMQLLQAAKETYLNALEKHLQSIREGFYTLLDQRQYENKEDFAERSSFREKLLQETLERERNQPEYVLPLRDLANRLAMATAYRNRLNRAGNWGEEGVQQALLDMILLGRWFVQIRTPLGRNMPAWSTNPGPNRLWGIGGHIAYVYPLLRSVNLMARLEGMHHQWFYNEEYFTTSAQNSLGVAGVLGIPIAVGARGRDEKNVQGVVVQLVVGGALNGRYTRVAYPNAPKPGIAPNIMGLGGIHFLFTRLPVSMEFEYSLGADAFGDLHVGLAVPISSGKLRGGK